MLVSMNKYYVCDVSMRNMLVRSQDSDIGHILENIIYLELKRRYREVYVGQIGTDGEVDFVAIGTECQSTIRCRKQRWMIRFWQESWRL